MLFEGICLIYKKKVSDGLMSPLYSASQNQLQKCILTIESESWSFFTTVNVHGFEWSNFVALCTDDWHAGFLW